MKTHYAYVERGNESDTEDHWYGIYCGLSESQYLKLTNRLSDVTCKNCLKVNRRYAIDQSLITKDMETKGWLPMELAPKTHDIEVAYDYDAKSTCHAVWSDWPVCMGGPTVYCKPGWATPYAGETDSNLPLDPPLMWREIQ